MVCNITNTTAFLTQVHSPHGCLNINILSESRSVGASEIHLCGNIIKHAERTRLAVQETFLLQGVGAKLGEFSQVQMGGREKNENKLQLYEIQLYIK